MKQRISKILGVGLVISLLASLMVTATPAAAGTLSISTETNTPKTDGNFLSPAGLDVVDMAVNGDTIYAATALTSSNLTYKSTDGGVSWTTVNGGTDYPTTALNSVGKLAVAPDAATFVAIVADTAAARAVYYSADGGAIWKSTGALPDTAAVVNDIAISAAVAGIRYLALSVTTSGGAGDLYTLKIDVGEVWQARADEDAANKTASTNETAVAFSPNFGTDKIILTVGRSATPAALLNAFRYLSATTGQWNDGITFFSTDWGNGATVTAITSNLVASSIAPDTAFNGTDSASRLVYVGLSTVEGTVAANGGVYRVNDGVVGTRGLFTAVNGGFEGDVKSLDLKGGKLVAGSNGDNQVMIAQTPTAADPAFDRVTSQKQPGGVNMTLAAWSGTKVVAATSGAESAFAVSTDSAVTFDDISLIDTDIKLMDDVAASADGATVWLATHKGANGSLWLLSGTWKRVLSTQGQTIAQPLSVRIAPADAKIAYIVGNPAASNVMWQTKDSGKTWKDVSVFTVTTVMDYHVAGADEVHLIDATGFTKTTSGGVTWTDKVSTGIANHMLAMGGTDILVGGSDGNLAFSTDAGATFNISASKPGSGNTHIAAAKDYATSKTVFAGSGAAGSAAVKRGKAQVASQTWATRSPSDSAGTATIDATHTIQGIWQNDTVTYIVTANTTVTQYFRALNLATADASATALWSSVAAGIIGTGTTARSVVMKATFPNVLKMSATANKFWLIDSASSTNSLQSIVDAIALTGPTQSAPADATVVPVNTVSGQVNNVTFTWKRQNTSVTATQIQIATDTAFSAVIFDTTIAGLTQDTVAAVVGPNAAAGFVAGFIPDTTYYWRVRTSETGPMYSAWSTTRNFRVGLATDFKILSPAAGASDVSINPTYVWTPFPGAVSYEIALATDPTFAVVEWSHTSTLTQYVAPEPLKNNTTYYVRVRGVTGTPTKPQTPAPGGPFVTSIFTTREAPATATVAPPAVITVPAPPQVITVTSTPAPAPIPSYLLWAIILIGAILVIALIVLIVRTRRVS